MNYLMDISTSLPEGVRLCGNTVQWYKRPLGFLWATDGGWHLVSHHGRARSGQPFSDSWSVFATEAEAVQALIDDAVDYDAHRASTKTKRFPRYSR